MGPGPSLNISSNGRFSYRRSPEKAPTGLSRNLTPRRLSDHKLTFLKENAMSEREYEQESRAWPKDDVRDPPTNGPDGAVVDPAPQVVDPPKRGGEDDNQ